MARGFHSRLRSLDIHDPPTAEDVEKLKEELEPLSDFQPGTPELGDVPAGTSDGIVEIEQPGFDVDKVYYRYDLTNDSETMDTNTHRLDLDAIDDSSVPPYIVDLKEEIADLEFKQQTEVLSFDDERELTETIEEKREELAELLGEMDQRPSDGLTTACVPFESEEQKSGGPIDTWANDDRPTAYEQEATDADALDGSDEPPVPLDVSFALPSYDSDGDDSAHLCCSECGERIELVALGEPFRKFKGGVCGCADPPGEWRAEELHTTSDQS